MHFVLSYSQILTYMLTFLNKIFGRFNYQLVPLKTSVSADISSDSAFMEIYEKCKPYTMTSPERLYSLYQSVIFVIQNQIPGDFVECGVWKGGSSMLIAHTLKALGEHNRKIWMYDTYEGMSEPDEIDKDYTGKQASLQLKESDKAISHSVWCYSSLAEVKANMSLTGYSLDHIIFVEGKVEDTIPGSKPAAISLLRLDTDWYSSTMHELVHLYSILNKNGVLIIDDFGHWEGAKKAVLEYFEKNNLYPLISRIDDTGRIVIKL